MTTALIPHSVGVEKITPILRRQYPNLPLDASLAVVERNANSGFCKAHTYATDSGGLDVHALAVDVAARVRAELLTDKGAPDPGPYPKPGVCPDCNREKSFTNAGYRGANQCPCKAKAGAR